jgi:hypothetical protein
LNSTKLIVSACGGAAIMTASVIPTFSANTKAPPYSGCVEVAKQEYNAAKKQGLLNTRFNRYVRTGRIGRRYYWYCHS